MITHDIQQFSNSLAAIYANIAKPVLDVFIYNYQLSQNVGAEGLFVLTVLMQGSTMLREGLGLSTAETVLIVLGSPSLDSTIWIIYRHVCPTCWLV